MQNPKKIAVMIVCDHPIMRDGLRRRVQQETDMFVVSETSNPFHILHDLHRCAPDVVMIDLQSPPGADLRAIAAIGKLSPRTPVVVLADDLGDLPPTRYIGQATILVVSKILASEKVIPAIRKAILVAQGSIGGDGRA